MPKIKYLLLIFTFMATFLLWPDFEVNYTYDCSRTSMGSLMKGGECPVSSQADYSNLKLGGGLRYILSNVCIKDKVYISSTECSDWSSFAVDRVPSYALLGSLGITAIIAFALYRNYILEKIHKL